MLIAIPLLLAGLIILLSCCSNEPPIRRILELAVAIRYALSRAA
jgi:hypothetical protein